MRRELVSPDGTRDIKYKMHIHWAVIDLVSLFLYSKLTFECQ